MEFGGSGKKPALLSLFAIIFPRPKHSKKDHSVAQNVKLSSEREDKKQEMLLDLMQMVEWRK